MPSATRSRADARSRDDGLVLTGCRITNAVKCLPPQNKPTPAEDPAVQRLPRRRPRGGARRRRGRWRWDASPTMRCCGRWPAVPADCAVRARRAHPLPGDRALFDSYHCSPLQHQHAAADAGDVRGGVRGDRRPPHVDGALRGARLGGSPRRSPREPAAARPTPPPPRRRSTRTSCCDRCRIGPASTGCSTPPATRCTSARRAT